MPFRDYFYGNAVGCPLHVSSPRLSHLPLHISQPLGSTPTFLFHNHCYGPAHKYAAAVLDCHHGHNHSSSHLTLLLSVDSDTQLRPPRHSRPELHMHPSHPLIAVFRQGLGLGLIPSSPISSSPALVSPLSVCCLQDVSDAHPPSELPPSHTILCARRTPRTSTRTTPSFRFGML